MIRLPYIAPAPLGKGHDVQGFDCGKLPLNEFLQCEALELQKIGSTRTFVATEEARVVGYFSLEAVEIMAEEDTGSLAPVPVMRIASLAVDRLAQGHGLGRALLRDAVLRTLRESDDLAIRALVAEAADREASRFFAHLGMTPAPENPLRLYFFF
jgi:GNAT superfamily N-acetyltransferase